MRHVIPVSGKDSLCALLVQRALEPGLPYTYLFADTGAELPETYAWLDSVEASLGIRIERTGRDLLERIAHYDMLPSSGKRFCTRESKIRPIEALLKASAEEPVTVYYGLRADEQHRPGPVTGKGITAAFPLQRVGFGLREVWSHLGRESEKHGVDLMPPAFEWPALHREVGARLGPQYADGLEVWQERELFAGRSRSNCFQCFFQRLYEWAWLLDVHPDLYAEAERLERETGRSLEPKTETSGTAPLFALPVIERPLDRPAFTWNADWPLRDFRTGRAAQALQERADVVAQRIHDLRTKKMFVADDTPLEMARTSCGLLCGK